MLFTLLFSAWAFLAPQSSHQLLPIDTFSPTENMATVHIYRPKSMIGFRHLVFQLSSNRGDQIQLRSGQVRSVQLDPGTITWSLQYALMAPTAYPIQLEAGRTYYMLASMEPGNLGNPPVLVEITEAAFHTLQSQEARHD